MEWSTTSNVQNERVAFMPPPWLESNSFNSLRSFNYDSYTGNSYKSANTQTGPVIPVPESEKIINAYQCPSNNNEMIKKNKRLTSEQLASLELRFQEDFKLDSERKLKLAKELGLEPRQVAVWFQNRRARWKVKHLEESYDSLRQEYDAIWREKQMLHDEVNKLRAIILRDRSLMMNSNQIAGGNQIYGTGGYDIG
ncbi:putative homeobox-leucine zipper protein ATHB-51 [Arabidopsis lyrata subsp. lyrata]|uniref:putative homeobox-leucine zipper protein ATHB-51 n=1 Tax=Arabidopsis lyrata subsp. lyrata TaxID=81972 RepID=UPI000A29E056|nr:putative homeobox-leucine zipper protein ATHB-51 [Arabidopsis lyrata subsp. lyrata]|eukprot:XP_020879296.1 putative homeobox-leucine zipper protein ATHB-51 [Arabidopsis lyrata subsp. lyrata]